MNISKITSNYSSKAKEALKPASKYINKAADSIGKTIEKSKFAQSFMDKFEAKGADNSFFGLVTIMLGFVLIPRIKSALGRNPNDKEKTKDEIAEILFRDIQTIAIMLFGLKSMNTIIGNLSTKMSGIPMVNKVYKPLIDKNAATLGEKATSVVKNLGKNILDTLNPLGGSVALDGKKIATKYSNYNSVEEIQKFLNNLPNEGGDKEKVFNKVLDSTIASQDKLLKGDSKKGIAGLLEQFTSTEEQPEIGESIERIKNLKLKLQKIKEAGVDKFINEGVEDKNAEAKIIKYFKDESNSLALGAQVVNAILKSLAFGIEVFYLGFGLPALNQKRLEKKYLNQNPNVIDEKTNTASILSERHIKAQEVKLYSNFLK